MAAGRSNEPLQIVVTGAGRGLGLEFTRQWLRRGDSVAALVRAPEDSAGLKALGRDFPKTLLVAACDVARDDSVTSAHRAIGESWDRVDILVNNAGVNRNGDTPTMKLDDFDAVASIGRGTWYLTKLILRRFMLRANEGRIINMTSVVGHTGNRGQVPYTMQKAGLDAMTKSLVQELRGRAILINSVAPGFIDTAMTRELPDEIRDDILKRIPLERLGQPWEVAEVVAFLATRASYVTGTVIHVNGGMYGG